MIGVLLLVTSLTVGQGESKPAADLEPAVRRLVRQLDAQQLARRDAAEEELLKMGPEILDLLPAGPSVSQPEVKERLARVRQKLQDAQARAVLEPSRVTLAGEMPLSKVIEAMSRQTGNRIVRPKMGDVEPTVKVSFEKTPFWEALDHVAERSGLTIYAYPEEKEVQLRVSPPDASAPWSGRVAYSGPFRFEAVRIAADRDLRRPAMASLKLMVDVLWEPRLSPIMLQLRGSDIRAVDERQGAIQTEMHSANIEIPVMAADTAKELILSLANPSRRVRTIARLDGKLHFTLPSKQQTFRFKDLVGAKNVEKRVAGATVIVESVQKNNDIWVVRTITRFDQAGDALASHRLWIFQNPAFLEGPDGKPVAHAGLETTRQTESEVGVAYMFAIDEPLEKYTFVYQTPAAIHSGNVEYQFKGIPLP